MVADVGLQARMSTSSSPADYLGNEAHFATFYCLNTNQGYFEVGNSAPFIPESASSNNPGASALYGDVDSSNGGSSRNAVVVSSGDARSGAAPIA
jgi:hypothetical protein